MFRQSVSRHLPPAPRAAFTFTEVLVVVVILGIASAIVLPQVASHDDLNAAAAARTVMADLLYAQNRAIAMQTMHFVSFDTANQQYTLYSSSISPTTVLTHPINLNHYVMAFGQTGPNNVSQTVIAHLREFQRSDHHRLR